MQVIGELNSMKISEQQNAIAILIAPHSSNLNYVVPPIVVSTWSYRKVEIEIPVGTIDE